MCDKTACQQPPHCDIRLDAANLLQAIRDHDPNLDCFDRETIESCIDVLDRSMAHDARFRNLGTGTIIEAACKALEEGNVVIVPGRS